MKIFPSGKDKHALLKTFANISGNLSAGWLGFAIITPGIRPPWKLEDILTLTISFSAGIVFAWFSYKLERFSS